MSQHDKITDFWESECKWSYRMGFVIGFVFGLFIAFVVWVISTTPARGQGVLGRPVKVEPAVKPAKTAPVNPSKPGPSASVQAPEHEPAIEIPTVSAWDPDTGIVYRFVAPWADAEIFLDKSNPYKGQPVKWESLGKVKEWRTDLTYRNGERRRAIFAARWENGDVRYADVTVKVGTVCTVRFR